MAQSRRPFVAGALLLLLAGCCGALAAAADEAAAAAAASASAAPAPAAGLDPDALSQRYRHWVYYPTWVIPPVCLNAATCAAHCNNASGVGCTTDVAQVVQLPEEVGAGKWRAFYLQFDGVGYETYSASSTDMVHFQLDDPTLAPGQPGVVYSPREGRPPMSDAKPAQGAWDWGSQTFIGPLLENYNVSATRVLRRATPDKSFWYAYGAYPQRNVYEPAPGADGFASSQDGLNWVRRSPHATVDTLADHGAQPWESGQVYAPFIIPAPDGELRGLERRANARATVAHSIFSFFLLPQALSRTFTTRVARAGRSRAARPTCRAARTPSPATTSRSTHRSGSATRRTRRSRTTRSPASRRATRRSSMTMRRRAGS